MPLKGVENVKQAVVTLTEERDKQLRGIFLTGLRNIALGTPADQGRARNSWFFSTTGSSPGNAERDANKGAISSLRGASRMPKRVFGRRMTYINNMPYINKLEYGGYPNPVKKGTFVKGEGFEQRSSGGFSRQAPNGWVRKQMKVMQKAIRAIN